MKLASMVILMTGKRFKCVKQNKVTTGKKRKEINNSFDVKRVATQISFEESPTYSNRTGGCTLSCDQSAHFFKLYYTLVSSVEPFWPHQETDRPDHSVINRHISLNFIPL